MHSTVYQLNCIFCKETHKIIYAHPVLTVRMYCSVGFETARTLAYFGATVILSCRNLDAANKCKQMILEDRPSAKIEVMHLDLASLKSVRMFAEEYRSKKW